MFRGVNYKILRLAHSRRSLSLLINSNWASYHITPLLSPPQALNNPCVNISTPKAPLEISLGQAGWYGSLLVWWSTKIVTTFFGYIGAGKIVFFAISSLIV